MNGAHRDRLRLPDPGMGAEVDELDALKWRFGLGAALILAGVIVIELVPRRSGEANPADALPRAD
jgi:hypothetical protein